MLFRFFSTCSSLLSGMLFYPLWVRSFHPLWVRSFHPLWVRSFVVYVNPSITLFWTSIIHHVVLGLVLGAFTARSFMCSLFFARSFSCSLFSACTFTCYVRLILRTLLLVLRVSCTPFHMLRAPCSSHAPSRAPCSSHAPSRAPCFLNALSCVPCFFAPLSGPWSASARSFTCLRTPFHVPPHALSRAARGLVVSNTTLLPSARCA